jgi:hypothetical protein
LNSGSNGDSLWRQLTFNTGGVHTGECFVILRASDASGSRPRLVLFYVVTELMQETLGQ